jgi:hypothetical protein
VPQQAVDHLVDRAVAADGHDHVDAVDDRLRAELAPVAVVGGLRHLDLQLAGQGVDQPVAQGRRRRGRHRVDHDERAHCTRLAAGCRPAWEV